MRDYVDWIEGDLFWKKFIDFEVGIRKRSLLEKALFGFWVSSKMICRAVSQFLEIRKSLILFQLMQKNRVTGIEKGYKDNT